MHRILAAVDLSDSTRPILQYSTELPGHENACLAVVHTILAAAPLAAVAWRSGGSVAASPTEEVAEYE